MNGTIVTIIILCAVMLVLAIIWSIYNTLVKLNERVNEAWSDITVQLKYRADLIPNLVEAVKGYAKHEKSAFENVTKARSQAMSAKTPKTAAEAEDALTSSLSKIFAIAESYPELKASDNFKELQKQLEDVEDKIQAARRFYNTGAKDLNIKMKVFPSNLFAKKLGFKTRDYFEVKDEEMEEIKDAPKIKFD